VRDVDAEKRSWGIENDVDVMPRVGGRLSINSVLQMLKIKFSREAALQKRFPRVAVARRV
jgi:hypothetical protein